MKLLLDVPLPDYDSVVISDTEDENEPDLVQTFVPQKAKTKTLRTTRAGVFIYSRDLGIIAKLISLLKLNLARKVNNESRALTQLRALVCPILLLSQIK